MSGAPVTGEGYKSFLERMIKDVMFWRLTIGGSERQPRAVSGFQIAARTAVHLCQQILGHISGPFWMVQDIKAHLDFLVWVLLLD